MLSINKFVVRAKIHQALSVYFSSTMYNAWLQKNSNTYLNECKSLQQSTITGPIPIQTAGITVEIERII